MRFLEPHGTHRRHRVHVDTLVLRFTAGLGPSHGDGGAANVHRSSMAKATPRETPGMAGKASLFIAVRLGPI